MGAGDVLKKFPGFNILIKMCNPNNLRKCKLVLSMVLGCQGLLALKPRTSDGPWSQGSTCIVWSLKGKVPIESQGPNMMVLGVLFNLGWFCPGAMFFLLRLAYFC